MHRNRTQWPNIVSRLRTIWALTSTKTQYFENCLYKFRRLGFSSAQITLRWLYSVIEYDFYEQLEFMMYMLMWKVVSHTCYPYRTDYCRCWSAAAHRRVYRLATCYPHQTDYCRYWSTAAHRRVVAHLSSTWLRSLPLLFSCCTQKNNCPPVIHMAQITAAIDQLLHKEE